MNKQELQKILEQLKQELASSEFTEPSAHQTLQKLIEKVEQVLTNDENAVQTALHEPLNDAVTRFETSHPQLTAILNNIISQLSNMGI